MSRHVCAGRSVRVCPYCDAIVWRGCERCVKVAGGLGGWGRSVSLDARAGAQLGSITNFNLSRRTRALLAAGRGEVQGLGMMLGQMRGCVPLVPCLRNRMCVMQTPDTRSWLEPRPLHRPTRAATRQLDTRPGPHSIARVWHTKLSRYAIDVLPNFADRRLGALGPCSLTAHSCTRARAHLREGADITFTSTESCAGSSG